MNIDKDKTIEYYNNNAQHFADGTINVNFSDIQDRFLECIHDDGLILDFGCGSGRDTKYFLKKGFRVEAIDGSEELCRIASENTGISVKHMLFHELESKEKYDGIWACASILHLPKESLSSVFKKMILATKKNGVIYVSFKYGVFEGYRNDRFFTDFTEESFAGFIKNYPEIKILDQRISSDVRPGREDEKWLNEIIKKVE